MDWLWGFILGFVADVFRSVFMPASTDWLNKFIPTARRKANFEENILTLEIMEKLKSLNKDPNLAKFARDDAAQFMNVLTSQQEAFVENAIEVIDSKYLTQTEMNFEAGKRAEAARQQMERALIALGRSGAMSESQSLALKATQELWEQYAKAQAEFSAAAFEGGSMAPMVYDSELEAVTLRRTGEIRAAIEELRDR